MPVAIRVAALKLVNITATGTVIDKDAASTTLEDIKASATKDFRVVPNGTGSSESPNAVDYPTLEEYLALEAGDSFALAHLDQTKVVTQMIT